MWEALVVMGTCFVFGFVLGAARGRMVVLRSEVPNIVKQVVEELK